MQAEFAFEDIIFGFFPQGWRLDGRGLWLLGAEFCWRRVGYDHAGIRSELLLISRSLLICTTKGLVFIHDLNIAHCVQCYEY